MGPMAMMRANYNGAPHRDRRKRLFMRHAHVGLQHACVRQSGRGFTLIEVMVVIVILGVLAALVVPRILSRPDEARAVAAKQDIAVISQALKLYRLDNQRYPTAEQGLNALVAKPETAPVPTNWKP